jgi:predicted porin
MSGLVISTPRDQQDYSLNGKYLFTEKLSGSLVYSYQQINYNSSLLTDISAHFVNGGMEYDLDKILPLVKVRGDVGFSHIDYSSSSVDVSTVDTYSATLGASRSLHELWSISADVGIRVSDYSFLVARVNDQRVGWIAKMAVDYRDDFNTGTLSFFHNLQNITGYAVPTEQTSVTLYGTHKFSKEFQGTLFSGFFLNSSDRTGQSSQESDSTTFMISPGLIYEFTSDLNLSLVYEYSYLNDRLTDANADRNRIFARLYYKFPIPLL